MFKGEHVGDLPTQQASNLQILAGMQSQLQNEQDALNTARQQQVYLQTLINQYRTLQGSPGRPTVLPRLAGRLPAIDKELDRLKAATGRSQLPVHRSVSGGPEGEDPDSQDREDKRPAALLI